MIIDEKGKLFGKINIIDLVIVLVVVAAVAILGYKFLAPKANESSASVAVAKYYIEEVTDFVVENVKIGDKCMDESKNVSLGTVTDIEIGDAVSYGTNDKGEFVQSSKPGHKSMIITTEVNATPFDHGMIVGASKYYVGHTFVFLAGKAKLYLRVYDIQFK